MREEFEKMAAAGKIEGRHIDALVNLTTSGYCMHRSWGFGRIKTVDTVFARFTIDFQNKPGHQMDLAFAAESLKAIPKEHILARKSGDLESLRQMAATNHLELVKLVLMSFGGKATVEQIQQMLVPDVIRDDWKKWWEAAKRELKKDGHFQVPLKKSEPVVYQEKETSLQDRLVGEFRAAKGLKARITVGTELLKSADDLSDKQTAAGEVITALNGEISSYQRTQPAVALEAIFLRDDIRGVTALAPLDGETTAAAIWSQELKLGPLLEQLPAAKHRRALESFKAANPERWPDIVLNALNFSSAKLCRELAGLLVQEGKMDQLKETVARLVSQHTANSELLLWLAKERTDAFADILGPEVFRAMLTAMERDQFNEKRSNRLREFILDDQELLADLTASADLEVIKDLTRALQLSPVFDDMDKRSLLARLVKSHPAIQSLISGEQTKQDTSLVVSWESLERRRAEYTELVHKKIPANSKEIAVARSYGDLRENHEYKAAKEMQKVLMRRKDELETQLVRARGTDFSNARTDVVSIGTVVHATDLQANQRETFTVLGAWDSDPDRGLVSYLSPVAQSLLNRKVGDEVEFELHGAKHRHRIDSIEPFKVASTETAPSPDQLRTDQPVPAV
jgi:transcription elongation GreA/GreB family factor